MSSVEAKLSSHRQEMAVQLDADVNMEPLPGYRLIDRLGNGGYGEVWRAEAPGGLTKAIKFIYGKHDERRASYEMKALERIRSVRHPFLLSLERIEVVGDRLIVVMELADGSVKERFEQCRAEGRPGIPRGEIVNYLRDAADALDYLTQSRALQHLDIKPENMLLLAGHVKVADFGLVNDVRHSQASAVGGLTPQYAAPEVFQGRASACSDQYSLGILYQEMLTGTLPFAGSSAAELTIQHLKAEPDLNALSSADRYVVSRALAKVPEHRYATCREFVDALSKAESAGAFSTDKELCTAPLLRTSQLAESLPITNSRTDLFDDESMAWNAEPEHRLIQLPASNASIVDLPAINIHIDGIRYVPALIVGLGGAAGKVLLHMRRMTCERFGGPAALPSLQMLLVDTDAKALSDASQRDRGLNEEETLHVPLRRPQHYREHSQQLLQWLSRRWLYNIPRSLRTEGLRPLGRLALADHARQLGQRLRRALIQAMDPAAIARSTEAIGREIRGDGVRVYVVASISGGSGGGMSLDTGYMVRAVLNKLGVSDRRITGIMLHATGGDPRLTELARVNAYSWLTEFHHFQHPDNAYPGDASCGLPSHEAGIGAFDSTYLVQLGEQLDAFEFDQAAESVADFLRLSILSPAQSFFDTCQNESDLPHAVSAADRCKVRSFGLVRRTAEGSSCDEFVDHVVRQVIIGWRSVVTNDATDAQNGSVDRVLKPRGADQLIKQLQLTSRSIATNARSCVEERLGERDDWLLASWMCEHGGPTADELSQFQAIDLMFDEHAVNRDDLNSSNSFLGDSVTAIAQPLEEKVGAEIRCWVAGRIDVPSERIEGAQHATAWLTNHLRHVETDLQQFTQTVGEKLNDIRTAVSEDSLGPSVSISDELRASTSRRALQYFRMRIDQFALAVATHAIRQFLSDAKDLMEELEELGRQLDYMLATASGVANSEPVNSGCVEPRAESNAVARLESRLEELAAEVDQKLQVEFLSTHGGLMPAVLRGGRLRAQMRAKLREFAGQVVNRTLAGLNVIEEVFCGDRGSQSELRSLLTIATPRMVQFGGTRRVLAVLPRDTADPAIGERLAQTLGTDLTTVAGDDNSLTLCVDSGQVAIPHAAVEFVQGRRDRIDFAARIHSRTDILWTSLLPTSAPCPWESDDYSSQQNSQELGKTVVV